MTEDFADYLSRYANGQITFDDFHDWFVDYTLGGDAIDIENAAAAEEIESAMAEFTGHHVTEEVFRKVIAGHLRVFTIVSSLSFDVLPARRSSSLNQTLRYEQEAVYA